MKKTKLISAVISAVTALTMLAAPACAYIQTDDVHEKTVTADKSTWQFQLKASQSSPFTNMSRMEAVVAVEGDTDQYFSDLADGAYEETLEWFGGFAGYLGLGARVYGDAVTNDWWYQFDFNGLNETNGSSTAAGIKELNSTTYLLSGDLTGIRVDGSASDPAIRIMDWGCTSSLYYLVVKEVFIYGPNGELVLTADGQGNYDTSGSKPFDASKYAEAAPAETTTEAVTEEVTEEEVSSEETTEPSEETEAAEESETAETTTAAQTTTTTTTTTTAAETEADADNGNAEETAATTAAAAQSTPSAPSADFGSRDSSLIIVGVAAGVIIVAAVVALVIVMTKKKK